MTLAPKPSVALAFSDGLLEIRCDYDELLVDGLRSLSGARYEPQDRTWRLRAGRENLTAVAVWLHDLGDAVCVTCDAGARRRVESCTPAWIMASQDGIVVSGPYNAARVRLLREVPEAVYEPLKRRWTVPVTRAGATALLDALDSGGWRFEADETTRHLFERVREGAPYDPLRTEAATAGAVQRRSPIPHWRHHVRGPIFEANRDRQKFVEGIGWCVRVRVDPDADR